MSESYVPREKLGPVDTGVESDQSPTLGKLADALAKAQGAFDAVAKSREAELVSKNGQKFSYSYADLASLWAAVRGPLSANGLAVVQLASSAGPNVIVTTTLLHSSGEWMRGRLSMPVGVQTPQGYGSAITYAKKYALAAMVGIAAEEDDDGAEASRAPTQRPPEPQRTQPPVNGATSGSRSAEVKAAARRVTIQDGPPEPPPPGESDMPPEYAETGGVRAEPHVERDDVVMSFGTGKGKPLSTLTDKDLAWYERALSENVADPAKSRWRTDNERKLAAVQAELRRRPQ